MKQLQMAISASMLAITIAGCAANGKQSQTGSVATLQSGNWIAIGRSSDTAKSDGYLRGNLTVSGSSVATVWYEDGLPAYQPTLCVPQLSTASFTGQVASAAATLQWTSAATTYQASSTVTATIEPDGTLLGTYAGTGQCTDTGTFYAAYVPAITGTWTGTLTDSNTSSGHPATTISGSITQAAATSGVSGVIPGSYALSGTVAVSNVACFSGSAVSLTVDATNSYVSGEEVYLVAYSQDLSTSFVWTGSLDDPTTALSMSQNGTALLSGSCSISFASTSSGTTLKLTRS